MFEKILVHASEGVLTPLASVNWIIQAVGGLVVIYLGFATVNLIFNWRKRKDIQMIKKDIREIKEMLDRGRNKRDIN